MEKIVFLIYLLVVMLIGIVASKYTKTTEGYFLGGRRLGAWVTAISSTASSESGWLVLGLVGEAYLFGMCALWIPVGCLLGYLFNWYILAPRLRKKARAIGALTVPDVIAEQVGDDTHLVRFTAVVIIMLLMFTYVAAQFNAAGKTFNAVFGWRYEIGVVVGALVTIFYTMTGGFKAVSWTDLLQGLLMVTALVILPLAAILNTNFIGGFHKLVKGISEHPRFEYALLEIHDKEKTVLLRLEDKPYYFVKDKNNNIKCQTTEELKKGEGEAIFKISLQKVKNKNRTDVFCIVETLSSKNDDIQERLKLNGTSIVSGRFILKASSLVSKDVISIGKWSLAFGGIKRSKPNPLSTTGGMKGLAFLGFLIGMLGIGLGYPGTPHVLTRYMAAKSHREIRQGRVIAIIWGILAMFGAVFTGLAGRVLLPHIADPDHGLLALTKLIFPTVVAGLVLAAVMAAIKSTADSQLLVAASAVTRDFYQKVLDRNLSEKAMVLITRFVVLILGLAAMGLALMQSRAIFWFVLFSWAGLGATFGPVLILSLYWKRLTKWGAILGMITGFSSVLIFKLYVKTWLARKVNLDLYELVPAFFLSLIITIIVSLFTYRKKEEREEKTTIDEEISTDDGELEGYNFEI